MEKPNTPRRMSARERAAAYIHYWKNPKRTPITLHEFPPVLAMLAQGIVWLLPVSTFAASDAYRLLAEIMPEPVWGAIWAAWALAWLLAILSRREPPRRFMTLSGGMAFAATGLLIIAANPIASWGFVLFATACTTWISYMELGAAGAALPPSGKK